jgi:hypothetical protein
MKYWCFTAGELQKAATTARRLSQPSSDLQLGKSSRQSANVYSRQLSPILRQNNVSSP